MFKPMLEKSSKCKVCFRHCDIREGGRGFCGGRTCEDGEVRASNYGLITSIALDPIEKKPLNRFHPGSRILSVGSYGCNLRCPFCQNSDISWGGELPAWEEKAGQVTPEGLAGLAAEYIPQGNIGVAFTYNEPLIGYEFVRDTARLVKKAGMYNVIVTNGCVNPWVLEEIAPYVDAMNIDLKGFTDRYYNNMLGGNRAMVMEFIRRAAKICHVELTVLIVPGENDTEEEMREISSWIASLECGDGNDPDSAMTGADIPLHISRFFPRFNMTDRSATDIGLIYRLVDTARSKLKYVYPGNC